MAASPSREHLGTEDLMYVLAMNRVRAAYVDIAPGVAHFFIECTPTPLGGSGTSVLIDSVKVPADLVGAAGPSPGGWV